MSESFEKHLRNLFYKSANTLIKELRSIKDTPELAEEMVDLANWSNSYIGDMAQGLHDAEIISKKEFEAVTGKFESLMIVADKRLDSIVDKEIEEDLKKETKKLEKSG